CLASNPDVLPASGAHAPPHHTRGPSAPPAPGEEVEPWLPVPPTAALSGRCSAELSAPLVPPTVVPPRTPTRTRHRKFLRGLRATRARQPRPASSVLATLGPRPYGPDGHHGPDGLDGPRSPAVGSERRPDRGREHQA